jgi:hypothetical protein
MALTKQNKLDQENFDNSLTLPNEFGTEQAPQLPASGLIETNRSLLDITNPKYQAQNLAQNDAQIKAAREANRQAQRPDAYVPMGELRSGVANTGAVIPSLSQQANAPQAPYQAPVPYEQQNRPASARTDRQRPLDQPIYTGGAIPQGGLAPGVAEAYQQRQNESFPQSAPNVPPARPAAPTPTAPAKAPAPTMAPAPTAPAKAPAPTVDPSVQGRMLPTEGLQNTTVSNDPNYSVLGAPNRGSNGLNSVDQDRYMRGREFVRQQSGQMQGGQPGATRGNNEIVGTFEGPAMQGTSGASMPVVVDPVTGAALPASDRFSQKEYTENLSPRTRGQLLETLSAGDDAVGQSLKKMASDSQQIDADPKMSPAQKMQAKQQLKNSQDQMIWSAMRDPTQLIATRRREQAAIERGDAQEQRQGQAAQERQAMLIQRRNTQLYQQAYKMAESKLSSDPFRSASPEEINSAALQIYLQSGGTMPGQDQSNDSGMAIPGNDISNDVGFSMSAPSGTAVAPGGMTNTAPKSGATDSISIDPQSPLDFQVTKSGSIVAMTPDGQPMRGMNFNGRAVAVPKNQAEIDLLPAGSLYVLEGEVRRGKMKEPIRKEGEVSGMSATGKEDPDKQEFDIASSVSTAGTKKSEKLAKVRAEYAEYETLLQDAKRVAGEKLTAESGKQAATETGEPILGNITPRTTKGSKQLNEQGVWDAEVQTALVELAGAKYGDKEKLPPSWVKRSGSKITGVDAPVGPEGFDPKSDAANDANLSEQEQAQVRQDYFGSKGTTESEVYMERLLDESKKSVGAVTFDRSGKQSVTVAGRTYPAVSVKVGNTSGRLPTAAMQPGKTEEDVARDALSLMISGKPFAIDVQGKMVPFKFDAKDPYFKAFALAKTVESGEISALQGAANKSLGAKAAFNFVNQVFGNLPVKSRKYILDNILTNQQLGKNFGGYSLTG